MLSILRCQEYSRPLSLHINSKFQPLNTPLVETDSFMVVLAFKSSSLIPWSPRNKLNNHQDIIKQMNFMVNHVYMEDNTCDDLLADVGFGSLGLNFWFDMPPILCNNLINNKLGLTNFRFTSF